ncbi:glycerophosphodiester phosphodiesterase [Nonomuraea phyllanthi]|uniref:Glycerophosphodiester phosphodiesterase n=2 Tax=Nonomuraea phyllanthi TaxID=2219224 RepID=A0A5C4W404_9ACTN|nr:glycerophosphodiester phosphodiesterase [Nonomuraea phyllanthi]
MDRRWSLVGTFHAFDITDTLSGSDYQPPGGTMYRLLGAVAVAVAAPALVWSAAWAATPHGVDAAPHKAAAAPSEIDAASRSADHVSNIAHRAGAAYAPENTLAACAESGREGADACEFDIQQTKDHELVLMHDQTLSRTTNVEKLFPDRSPWRVADFTLAEIRRLDAGSWFSSNFRGEKVPTLEEALQAMDRYGVGLMLEIKHGAPNAGIDRRVADVLKGHRSWWRSGGVAVQAFDWKAMRNFHGMMPEVPIVLLGNMTVKQLSGFSDFAQGICRPHSKLSAHLVTTAHDNGLRVYTGTTDKPGLMRRMLSYGVDGIMTNLPGRLADVMGAR